LPNPSLHIVAKLPNNDNIILGGEKKDLEVVIENTGKGLAEDIKIVLQSKTHGLNDSLFKDNYNMGNLQPHSSLQC
jgi:hypothetical protein